MIEMKNNLELEIQQFMGVTMITQKNDPPLPLQFFSF